MAAQNLKYKLLTGFISIGTITTLLVDYFYTNEFHMEGYFLFTTLALLIINMTRQFNQKIWKNRPLGVITNTSIILVSTYCFYILFIILWGYGFTGRPIQAIWVIMTVSCVSLFILTIVDVWRIIGGKIVE